MTVMVGPRAAARAACIGYPGWMAMVLQPLSLTTGNVCVQHDPGKHHRGCSNDTNKVSGADAD